MQIEQLQAYSTQAPSLQSQLRHKQRTSEVFPGTKVGEGAANRQLFSAAPAESEGSQRTLNRASGEKNAIAQDSRQSEATSTVEETVKPSPTATGRFAIAGQHPPPSFLGNRKAPTDVWEAIQEVQVCQHVDVLISSFCYSTHKQAILSAQWKGSPAKKRAGKWKKEKNCRQSHLSLVSCNTLQMIVITLLSLSIGMQFCNLY